MKTTLKYRNKTTVAQLQPGQTFKYIQKDQCLMVVDLTKTDMFKNPVDGNNPILRDDVVYYVDTDTGIIGIVPKSTEVHEVVIEAREI